MLKSQNFIGLSFMRCGGGVQTKVRTFILHNITIIFILSETQNKDTGINKT